MRHIALLSRLPLLTLLGVLAAPAARADGECFGGYRDTTAAERETMRAALQSALDAMPPPPEGWVVTSDDTLSVIEGMCRDFDQGPWTYGKGRSYQRVDDREARDRLLQEAADAMVADMAAKQARADAIMARVQELTQQVIEAGQKSDYERVDAINRDIEAASNEYQALMAEGDADDRMAAAQVEAGRDLTMYVEIDFNYTVDAPGYDARPWAVAGVNGKAFRWSSSGDIVAEDHALVLIGDWTATGDGRVEVVPDTGRGAAVPQSISVRVTADAGRLEQMVRSIDFDALERTLPGH